MKKKLSVLLAVLLFPMSVLAKRNDAPDLAFRTDHYYATFLINKDGSDVATIGSANTVLEKRGLSMLKQKSISYSASMESIKVLSAYTRKADGHRIAVPKTNFQLNINSGKAKQSPAFSDIDTLTVVFPDVEVGDTVVLSYRLTQHEPMFPGEFSTSFVFPKNYEYDDVRIKVDAPASLWAQYEARGMHKSVTNRGGRKVIEATLHNRHPVRSDRRDYSVYDIETFPGFAYSTFRSYAQIAEAYGVRARPKAAVTDRIQKLAARIVKNSKTPRDEAAALYDWVATNISYAGNCIGVGAVVPHDTDAILDNRMGDCKDHATLLQALLSARGIDSTQALINASGEYTLPRIPGVSSVNHVITYIPSLNQFADSTSPSTPFGMLPFVDIGKPILLVDGYKRGMRTPVPPVESNQQHMQTVMTINPDGSVTGRTDIELKGMFAAITRAAFKNLSKNQQADFVKDMFQKSGFVGSGALDEEDPAPLLATYKYSVTFNMKNFLDLPGMGGFKIRPLIYSEAPVDGFMAPAVMPVEKVDVSCASGYSEEQYTLNFPKSVKILAVPKNMNLANDFLAYRSTYSRHHHTLVVTRTLDDKTPGNVCSPAMMAEYKKFDQQAVKDIGAQVIYQTQD